MSVSGRRASDQRYRAMRKVSIVGALVNVLLAVVKLVFGFIAQSQALIADALHSFADLATDALVLFAARHSNEAADEDHPYGHARIETAVTVVLGAVLMLTAIGIVLDAGLRLLTPERLLQPGPLALVVALLSILANEWLYQYTVRVGRRIKSALLRANAWHHRTDALSSVIVLIGVGGALLGFRSLDAIAAVGVALMIGKIGWDQAWQAVEELIDTGLEPERVDAIRTRIADVDGVRDLHMLRTRRMGGNALVDVHVQVNPRLSVSEGHQIGEYVRTKLVESVDEVTDVTVHIDPEDDASSYLCAGLPLRRQILAELYPRWRPLFDTATIKAIDLHYLSGTVHLDLLLPLETVPDLTVARQLAERIRASVADLDYLGPVQVHFG
ncbi:MAG: cation diffusion facilitator family transporter [Candidatus Competibacterales bacterium]|nr:cation diffusion facilitator family transporter [Candidatus Competibacterales bacterium]